MLKNIFSLLRDTAVRFAEDRATLFAASLAYYTIFSLAPLLVIAIAVAGFFVGRTVAQQEVISTVEALAGPQVAAFTQNLAEQVANSTANTTFTILGIAVLIYGASGVFNTLRHSINFTWGIATGDVKGLSGILAEVKSRALTFVMVFVVGLLLVGVLVADFLLSTVEVALGGFLPQLVGSLPNINILLAPMVAFVMFLITFKLLPDAQTRWRDVALGALFTATAFGIGAFVIGQIILRTSTASIYGAASALILLLLWVYYSSIIVLFGAELTFLYAQRYGQPIQPASSAMHLADRYARRRAQRQSEAASADNDSLT